MQRLMENIFDGFVFCFRKFSWHKESSYSDITQAELSHFSNLGEALGYHSKREMNWKFPRDLCWVKPNEKEAFMYMERENNDSRCEHTITKMLNKENAKDVQLLIANFGWLKEESYNWACKQFQKGLELGQCALLFAWVGESKNDGPFIVKAATFNDYVIKTRQAIPYLDAGGFWQLTYEKESNWANQ